MAQRFASLSETDLVKLSESKDSKNTKAATKQSVKPFRTYLAEKGHDSSFETYSSGLLNSRLRSFYAEVRNASGERYKRTTLIAIRSGLCRYLSQSTNIDITQDVEFKEANDMFDCMCKDTGKTGKGTVDHKVPIEKADLERLYGSRVLDTMTPYGLLNKVWFELCLYFCRRGRENQRELKPSMFDIRTDAFGKRYVCQLDSELSKNHQGIKHSEIQDKNVRMYETGGKMCPVKSFEKYLSKLNPKCEALFQTPRDCFFDSDPIWYENRPLGKNKLGTRMKELSTGAGLSQEYTNHCIRATAITALSHAGFEARHIMTVSGHRNEASVKSYVRDTTVKQKKEMSATISSLAPEPASVHEFEDGLNDVLALSLSQTESILKDITSYENQQTSSTINTDLAQFSKPHPQHISAGPVIGSNLVQADIVAPHPTRLSGGPLNAINHVRAESSLQIQNNALGQGQSSFSFHGCQFQFHNYN